MDIWSWMCELTDSYDWSESDSPPFLELVNSSTTTTTPTPTQSIQLKAQRIISEPDSEPMLKFSLCIEGFNSNSSNEEKTIWVSDTCPISSDKPLFLPFVLQMLREIISRSPSAQVSTCLRKQLQGIKPDPVIWIMDSHSPESFSSFFKLVFLTRLFWLCACDAPAEVGSLYFQYLLGPNLESLLGGNLSILKTFLVSVGVDVELCLMHTMGYMLAKWFILREVGAGLKSLNPLPSHGLGFSYATEAHGLWVLKGYAPVSGMKMIGSVGKNNQFPIVGVKESALKYALAHQQLEAVIQLEYSVKFCEGFIQVNARVDNLRIHVAKLGLGQTDDVQFADERYFPSRIRVWVGPEVGSTYVAGLTLGRSTDDIHTEKETQKIVKGSFGKLKIPKIKATSRTSTRTKMRNWRWDQDAEGNAAIFDVVLCNKKTGGEVALEKPPASGGGGGSGDGNGEFRKRYSGVNRLFTKSGSLVLAGDTYGEGVGWRLNKEMEGSVLKWRIGGQVWLSYWPSEVKSAYHETRCVEWCDEVDLPLIIPSK